MDEQRRVEPDDRPTLDQKLADLQHMKTIAFLLLVLMGIVFVATTTTTRDDAWIPYARAFAEAGMVGACADWFAVVALFRHPLGLPIPHTAIVPNNKDRIGAALGRFIATNFLSPRVAHRQLGQFDMVGALARWLDEPATARQLFRSLGRILPGLLTSLHDSGVESYLGATARRRIEAIPAAPLAAKFLTVLWAGGAAQTGIERALDACSTALAHYRPKIKQAIAQQSSRWIPRWIDDIVAERVTAGLATTLQEMRDPDHFWRIELRKGVEKLIADLDTDPEMLVLGETLKQAILDDPLFLEQVRALWSEIDRGLQFDLAADHDRLSAAFSGILTAIARWLRDDPGRTQRLNRQVRLTVLRMVLPRRVAISNYITQVVHNWDDATLVRRLEAQVGKDLQYIRINGTLIGGLVGMLIFTAARLLEPR